MHYIDHRSKRTLTDADIKNIVDCLKSEHVCVMDPDTKHLLKTLTDIYKDAHSAIIKAMIGLIVAGLLLLAAIGSGFFGGKG